jgi:hypothetical protein
LSISMECKITKKQNIRIKRWEKPFLVIVMSNFITNPAKSQIPAETILVSNYGLNKNFCGKQGKTGEKGGSIFSISVLYLICKQPGIPGMSCDLKIEILKWRK